MGKKKTKRKYRPGSGMKKYRDAQRRVKVLERKVKRWDKYREKGKKRLAKTTVK